VAILSIRKIGDPVLREPCLDVESFDRSLRQLYEDMLETMYEAPGVGLAAPQIGLSLRFFVFDAERGGGAGAGAVANPVLSQLEGEQVDEEGCLSIPGLWAVTPRANRVRVDGHDLDGRPISMTGEGLLARIFQHETDHLNGSLFIDRLPAEERKRVMAELRQQELSGRDGPVRRPSR
jgi:peptide deformylase